MGWDGVGSLVGKSCRASALRVSWQLGFFLISERRAKTTSSWEKDKNVGVLHAPPVYRTKTGYSKCLAETTRETAESPKISFRHRPLDKHSQGPCTSSSSTAVTNFRACLQPKHRRVAQGFFKRLPYFDNIPVEIPTDIYLLLSILITFHRCLSECIIPFLVQFRASRIKPHKYTRHRTAEFFEVQKWTKVGTIRLGSYCTSRTKVGGWKRRRRRRVMPVAIFSGKIGHNPVVSLWAVRRGDEPGDKKVQKIS